MAVIALVLSLVGGVARARGQVPAAATAPIVPATADEEQYRCHLDEDLACTVVRQTTHGLVVLSYRPAGAQGGAQAWSVVVGNATTAGRTAPAGTVLIVPPTPVAYGPPDVQLANGAPILD